MNKSQTLTQLIDNLKYSPKVLGVFFTGSTITGIRPSSDIDLVIILKNNSKNLRSIYTMIEGHFADIFFFDQQFLQTVNKKKNYSANTLEGIFVTWILQGKIVFDPKQQLQQLQNKQRKRLRLFIIPEQEKREWWVKINYNFIANERYFNSPKPEYKSALELRLLYSVTELITAYFAFRDLPWRGEKAALKYLTVNDSKYYKVFKAFTHGKTASVKMKAYLKLFSYTCTKTFKPWGKNFVIPLTQKNQYNKNLVRFWNLLLQTQ